MERNRESGDVIDCLRGVSVPPNNKQKGSIGMRDRQQEREWFTEDGEPVEGVELELRKDDRGGWSFRIRNRPKSFRGNYASQQEARAAVRRWFKHWAGAPIPIRVATNMDLVDKFITVDDAVPGG